MVNQLSKLVLLSALYSFVAATPIQFDHPVPCRTQTQYTATASTTDVTGPTSVLGATCQNVAGATEGCQVSVENGYSVGVSVEVGADLGLDYGEITGGISVGVTFSTETTTAESITLPCPLGGSWTCAIAVNPTFLVVSGTQQLSLFGDCLDTPPSTDPQPYTVDFPETDGGNIAKKNGVVCACPDKLGWADAGAPPTCPSNCG